MKNSILIILLISTCLAAVTIANNNLRNSNNKRYDDENIRNNLRSRGSNKKYRRRVSHITANISGPYTRRKLDYELIPVDMIDDEQLADYTCGMRYSEGEEDTRQKRFIQEGFSAGLYNYPSFLRLRVTAKQGFSFSCGATLINRRYAVTATHCVLAGFGAGKTGRDVAEAVLESTIHRTRRKDDPVFRVEKRCPLPRPYGDVALLKLAHSVMYSRTLQPACLSETIIENTDPAVMVGFGGYNETRASLGIKQWGPELQALPVKRSFCPEISTGYPTLCFRPYNIKYLGRACAGDAGGPVYANFDDRQTLVGIVARGNRKCINEHGPGKVLVANVHAIRQEILNTMKRC